MEVTSQFHNLLPHFHDGIQAPVQFFHHRCRSQASHVKVSCQLIQVVPNRRKLSCNCFQLFKVSDNLNVVFHFPKNRLVTEIIRDGKSRIICCITDMLILNVIQPGSDEM